MAAEREHPGTGHGAIFRLGRQLAEASARVPRGALRFLAPGRPRHRRAPPAGSRPGEMAVAADAEPPHIRVMRYSPDGFEERDGVSADDLRVDGQPGGTVTWIDVAGFGDRAVLERLREALGIHPLAMADVVNVPQRPKAELHDDRLLVVTAMAQLGESGGIDVEQLGLLLGPAWVVTFQEHPGDVFDPVRERIRSAGSRLRSQGADFLAYALIDAVVDGYFAVVEALGGVLEALEEEVMEASTRSTLARIHAARRELLSLHRIQWRQRDAVGLMMRDESMPISSPVRPYLRDVHDHAFQTLDAIENYRDLAMSLTDLYLSNASNRLNEVMKTLTIVASIFIPMSFVAGVYGMNFRHMPELQWRFGYAGAWGVMLAMAVGLAVWFWRRGWLAPDPSTRP